MIDFLDYLNTQLTKVNYNNRKGQRMAGLQYSPRKFERLLKNNGYKFERQTGDHRIFTKDGCGHISFNMCKLNPIVVQRLIKENKLEVR